MSGSGLSQSVADGAEPSAGVQQQYWDPAVRRSDWAEVYAAGAVVLGVDTCIHLVGVVGRRTALEAVAEHFYLPEVVLLHDLLRANKIHNIDQSNRNFIFFV